MNYQKRDKFFWVQHYAFEHWPFEERYAIGMNFADFKAMKAPRFNFIIGDEKFIYSIEKHRALLFGNKYQLRGGCLPNLIPKGAFDKYDFFGNLVTEGINHIDEEEQQ
jgi:hypothetical protein